MGHHLVLECRGGGGEGGGRAGLPEGKGPRG